MKAWSRWQSLLCPWRWHWLGTTPSLWRKGTWPGIRDAEAWREQIRKGWKIQSCGPNLLSPDLYELPQVVLGLTSYFNVCVCLAGTTHVPKIRLHRTTNWDIISPLLAGIISTRCDNTTNLMLIWAPDWQLYMALINKKWENKLLPDKCSLFGSQKSFKRWGPQCQRRERLCDC